ncbi:unnamed protein product [Phytomonas sp. EM1]|nr:unnamed protein product [Phytomonas sp. EM1]|eukprot:CCW63951.1 unnamed protein product [Phytomonas sp. isolate EM1]
MIVHGLGFQRTIVQGLSETQNKTERIQSSNPDKSIHTTVMHAFLRLTLRSQAEDFVFWSLVSVSPSPPSLSFLKSPLLAKEDISSHVYVLLDHTKYEIESSIEKRTH